MIFFRSSKVKRAVRNRRYLYEMSSMRFAKESKLLDSKERDSTDTFKTWIWSHIYTPI